MYRKPVKQSKKLVLWLLGLVIVLAGFRWKTSARKLPSQTKALKNSKYSSMLPFFDAMAKHETGNFTNTLTKYNNIFSMGVPFVRPFTRIGTVKVGNMVYSTYRNTEQASQDLIKWMDWTRFPTNLTTSTQFATQLKQRSYFEDNLNNYINGINRFL